MLIRGTNGLEIEVEEQVATAMISAGIVEAVAGIEPVADVEDPQPPEDEDAKKAKK